MRIRTRTKLLSAASKGGGLQVKVARTIEIEGEASTANIAETIAIDFAAR